MYIYIKAGYGIWKLKYKFKPLIGNTVWIWNHYRRRTYKLKDVSNCWLLSGNVIGGVFFCFFYSALICIIIILNVIHISKISDDLAWSLAGPGVEQVKGRRQVAVDGLLGWPNDPLQSAFVLGSGGSEPDGDWWGEDGLNDGCVELHFLDGGGDVLRPR